MATVRFTIPDEFLAELEKDQPLVQRGIVRITHLYRDSTLSPLIRPRSVVATTRIGDDVVRLSMTAAICGRWRTTTRR